jgi:hypothetical protein
MSGLVQGAKEGCGVILGVEGHLACLISWRAVLSVSLFCLPFYQDCRRLTVFYTPTLFQSPVLIFPQKPPW